MRKNHISGIYSITCLATGKRYVGSSKSIRARWSGHKSELRKGKHPNPLLQNAWNKYGEAQFKFEVLELVPSEQLLDYEQRHLDNLTPFDDRGFNILKVAGSPTGYKFSEEAKEKKRVFMLLHNPFRGKKHSKDSREHMQRVSPNSVGVVQKSKDGTVIAKYPSTREATRAMGLKSKTSIAQVLDKPNRYSMGFLWETDIGA